MARDDWARNRKGESSDQAVARAHETIREAAANGNLTAQKMHEQVVKEQK